MLEITTHKNYLKSNNDGDKFCFRSYITETLTTEQLVQEIMNYNSTITKPDASGVLDILSIIVKRFVARGYDVELPFGYVHTTASGTCGALEDAFQPGNGNNRINIIIRMKDDAVKEIVGGAVFRQMNPGNVGDPKITSIHPVLDDSSESSGLSSGAGKMIRIRGRNFSLDLTDQKQGVFFSNGTESYRALQYSRSGTSVIDAYVPAALAAGTYQVRITAKPGANRYEDDLFSSPLEVTA